MPKAPLPELVPKFCGLGFPSPSTHRHHPSLDFRPQEPKYHNRKIQHRHYASGVHRPPAEAQTSDQFQTSSANWKQQSCPKGFEHLGNGQENDNCGVANPTTTICCEG